MYKLHISNVNVVYQNNKIDISDDQKGNFKFYTAGNPQP